MRIVEETKDIENSAGKGKWNNEEIKGVLLKLLKRTLNGGKGIYSFPVKEAYEEWYNGETTPKYPANLVNKLDKMLKDMGVEGHKVHYATLEHDGKKEQRIYVNLAKAKFELKEE